MVFCLVSWFRHVRLSEKNFPFSSILPLSRVMAVSNGTSNSNFDIRDSPDPHRHSLRQHWRIRFTMAYIFGTNSYRCFISIFSTRIFLTIIFMAKINFSIRDVLNFRAKSRKTNRIFDDILCLFFLPFDHLNFWDGDMSRLKNPQKRSIGKIVWVG